MRFSINLVTVFFMLTVSSSMLAQIPTSDTSLERSLYTLASSQGADFGVSGFRLCAAPLARGAKALVVFWDQIGDPACQAKIGFFDRGQLIAIETNEISDLALARSNGVFPSLQAHVDMQSNRHIFETREQYIPADWKQLLDHLQKLLDEAGIVAREEFECAWLVDLKLDLNAVAKNDLSILFKRTDREERYTLVRPTWGVTIIDVVASNSANPAERNVTELISVLRKLPNTSLSFCAVDLNGEIAWSAVDSSSSNAISFQLENARSKQLSALCGGTVPSARSWAVIEKKLLNLRTTKVLRSEIDEREFCRWLVSEVGPTPRRMIDPAVLLIE